MIDLDDLSDGVETVSWGSRRGPHHLFELTAEQRTTLRERNAPAVVKVGDIEVRLGGVDHTAQSLIAPSTTDGVTRVWGARSLVDHSPALMPDKMFAAILAELDKRAKKRQEEAEGREDRPGDVYNERADWEDLLVPLGWKFIEEKDDKRLWARPGQAVEGKPGATTGFCSTDARPDMLYVFSATEDAIAPFSTGEAYTKFEAYTLINHDGDYAEATRALAAEGYEYEPEFEEIAAEPVEVHQPLLSQPPELPEWVFDNFLGQYVLDTENGTEAHRDSIYMQALELFGNFVGRAAYLQQHAGRQYLNGYLCVIGLTGDGRKGTALRVARRPFQELVDAEHQFYINKRLSAGLASGEGLIAVLSDAGEQGERRYMAEVTEIASLIPKIRMEGSILSGVLRSAYDGDVLSNPTKNNPSVATNAHVSMILHSTPADYQDLVRDQDIRNGFINRMIFVVTEKDRIIYDEEPISSDIYCGVAKQLEDCYEWIRSRTHQELALALDDDAKAVWRRLYDEYNSGTADYTLDALLARRMNHAKRYAGRFALLDRSEVIKERHLLMAEVMVNKSVDSINSLSDAAQHDSRQDVLQFIRDCDHGCTRTDLYKHARHNIDGAKTSRELDSVVTNLLSRGAVKQVQEKKKRGRPTVKYVAT